MGNAKTHVSIADFLNCKSVISEGCEISMCCQISDFSKCMYYITRGRLATQDGPKGGYYAEIVQALLFFLACANDNRLQMLILCLIGRSRYVNSLAPWLHAYSNSPTFQPLTDTLYKQADNVQTFTLLV